MLRSLSCQKNLRFRKRFLEKELHAVVVQRNEDGAQVLTSNFIHVRVPWCPKDVKQRIKLKITSVSEGNTEGVVVEHSSGTMNEGDR